jgi:dihydrofolate synthase/folylpolyglutamate synthase
LVFQDETGLLDLPLPALPGAHQVENAGMVLAALRALGHGEAACEAAMTNATWPARMQRLRKGPLAEAAPGAEIWLDGGHNPHAARAIADHMRGLPERPTYLVCGMLNTKDVAGFMRPVRRAGEHLWAVSIPGQKATLPAAETAQAARTAGIEATEAQDVGEAVAAIAATAPEARILICGSLYFAGEVLARNG